MRMEQKSSSILKENVILRNAKKIFNNVIKKLTFKPSYERDVMFV